VGYQLRACPESLTGTSIRAMEEEVSKKVDLYVNMLQKSAEKCEDQGVIYIVNNSCKDLIILYMERRCVTMNIASIIL
jgi:hypothetical protein